MPGENILIVDDSAAVQELCRTVLENEGYRVSVASNGVAALSYPEIDDVDLLIIDTHMHDMSGFETTRAIKTDEELFRKPVLLLVPEEEISAHESQNLMGANAYLKKPFEPNALVNKVQVMIEEKQILERGREYLRGAADGLMTRLAEETVQAAVEHKTQIIIERILQTVVTQVDQRVRKEVDSKVTQLSTDKEQELVKTTVHEVARSMVEKLAEKKVTEAMDVILREQTDRMVKRTADALLPGLVRDRLRESVEQVLPKEIERRVQKAVEGIVPEAAQKVVGIIESAAHKVIPKLAPQITEEVVDRRFTEMVDSQLPRHVQRMVSQELEAQVRLKIAPVVNEAVAGVKRRITALLIVALVILGLGFGFIIADRLLGANAPWAGAAGASAVVSMEAGDSASGEEPGRFRRMWLMAKRKTVGD